MQQKNKKWTAFVLTLVMLASLLPSGLFAADPQADPSTTTISKPQNQGPVDLVEQGDNKSYKDNKTQKIYYKVPNWAEESVKNKGLTRWDLQPDQKLRVVNNMSETVEITQLNYQGYHETPDGGTVLDLVYSSRQRADSGVWNNVSLFISPDLAKSIDWTKSYYYNAYEKKDENKRVKFVNGRTDNEKVMYFSKMAQGALAGSVQHTPIRLYLKNKTIADLDDIDTTIQSRVTNDDNTQIFTKYMGNTKDSNILLEGYGSYTSSTTIPKTSYTNFRAGILPYLRSTPAQITGAQNTISYNPAKDTLYIATNLSKGDTNNANEIVDGESLAYRLAFSKNLLDILEPDENGFIGYVEPSKTSGAQAGVNPNQVKTGFTKDQVNVVGDMAYVLYAPQEFTTNNETGQIIYTTGGTAGFLDNLSTELSDMQFTLTTLHVNSDKLKTLYPLMNGIQQEMMPLDVYSTLVAHNSKGMDTVAVKTTQDVNAQRGDKVEIRFAKQPALEFLDWRPVLKKWAEKAGAFDAKQLVMKLGTAPLAGDMGIYFTRFAGGAYTADSFEIADDYKTYTYTLPYDIHLPEGTAIRLFAGCGGNMADNSAEIYINGTKVASFDKGDAKKSYAPRALVGLEAYSSTLIDRAQYMPAILDTFDTSKTIEGYTKEADKSVEMAYNDDKTKMRKYIEAFSSKTAEKGAKYVIDGVIYPEGNNGLYRFSKEIESDDQLIKDGPIAARAFDYQSAETDTKSTKNVNDGNTAVRSALGSDPVIAKVMSTVTFDLNGGKYNATDNAKIKSFEGGHPGVGYNTERQAANSPVIRILPINKHFATDKDYVANGFVGENAVLKDNTGVDLTGDALALRKFAETDADGKNTLKPEKQGAAFLGWTTQKLTGKPADVTKAFKALTVADKAEQTNDTTKNYIFTDKTPTTKSIRVYAAYGVPLVKFHTNPPKDAKDAQGKSLTDKIFEQTITEQAITDREIQLNKNYGTEDFNIPGYSLVGYSTKPDAIEPDANETGTGFEKDLYLRDNDVMKLTEEQANRGINLYAVWRPNYHVDVTKIWDPADLEANNKDKIKVGLLTRPAVGTQGQEVVTEKAVYRPVPGTVKALSDAVNGKLTWENLKSYDEKGHRMSYIAVELTASTEALFNAGSTDYAKYGVDIQEKHEDYGETIWGHKNQLLNTDGVDVMTAATERNHYNAAGQAVNPHHPTNPIGYFGTYGYAITLTNKKATVEPPRINPVIEGGNQVEIVLQGEPDWLIVNLPDNTVIKLEKNKVTGRWKKHADSSSKATFAGPADGKITITLPSGQTFSQGQQIKAAQAKWFPGSTTARSSIDVVRTVEAKPVSNQVTNITQQPKDESGNVPVKFQVPNPPVDPPKQGTKYTIGTVDESGNFTPIESVDPITLDADVPSDTSVTIDKTFTIPADKLDGIKGKDLVIKSEEPDKAATDSDKFKLDLTAPTATVKAEDEIWRRWVDVRLSQLKGDAEVIVVNYKDVNGTDQTARFTDTNDAEEAIEVLRGQNVTDMKITLKDKYGNVNVINPTYTATKVIKIDIRTPRLGKNFVQVRSAQDATTVSVRIFNASDAQAVKERAPGYADKATHTATVTLNKNNKFTKITFDNGYKLTKGDLIEFVGITADNGITNPYAFILGQ